ncbi:DNA mismatch repair protein [Hysterangium stoloniferum]|nr:DNA mismatch repair protein [Hysterangium stoloniferum]
MSIFGTIGGLNQQVDLSRQTPCAGNDGTTITAEDLCHSTPLRPAALKSPSDEYARILDVITRYAIHNPSVSFVYKKAGSTSPDLSTPSKSAIQQTIGLLYGSSVGKALLHVSATGTPKSKSKSKPGRATEDDELDQEEEEDDSNSSEQRQDDTFLWVAESYTTEVNYHTTKMVFLLFINHRLVESPRIKKAIEAVYSGVLPKGACPFVYLSLHLDPKAVVVNVHPTRREVHFLDEEHITQRICDAIQEALVVNSGSRTFQYQTLLTGGVLEDEERPKGSD